MDIRRCATWILSLFFLCAVGVGDARGENLTLGWDPSHDSSVAGYRVFVGTQTGRYTTIVDVGPQLHYVFTGAQPGRLYYFAVASYSAGGVVGALSSEVSGRIGSAPLFTLSNPGDVTSALGAQTSIQLYASAPVADRLTYTASGLPPGTAIDPTTGLIAGTPTTEGTFRVTATVASSVDAAAETFMWTVGRFSSRSPVLGISIPTPGPKFTTSEPFVVIGGTADDDEGVSAVHWTNDRGESGRATGTMQWVAAVPLQPGKNEITITAVDAHANQSRVRLSVYHKVVIANPFRQIPDQRQPRDRPSTLFRD